MKNILILSPLLALLAAIPVQAQQADTRELGVESRIVFPDRSIRNFKADGDDALWIEDQHGDWFYATVIGPCTGLNFARGIGFDSDTSSFDRFSSIIVEGRSCQLNSLVTSAPPPTREQREAAREAANNRQD